MQCPNPSPTVGRTSHLAPRREVCRVGQAGSPSLVASPTPLQAPDLFRANPLTRCNTSEYAAACPIFTICFSYGVCGGVGANPFDEEMNSSPTCRPAGTFPGPVTSCWIADCPPTGVTRAMSSTSVVAATCSQLVTPCSFSSPCSSIGLLQAMPSTVEAHRASAFSGKVRSQQCGQPLPATAVSFTFRSGA
ncbi:hypothetical protein VTK26DRAFT_4438 [Humicola hyalothermophila]